MTEWMNERSRPRLIASFLLIVTFLVGGLSGAALSRVLDARQPTAAAPAGEPATPQRRGPDNDRRERTPYNNIGMTDEQRARVEALLAERHRRIDSIWGQNEPAMRAIMASSRAEIEALLTDEQRALLEERRAQWRDRRGAEAQQQKEER
jgi:Spy/CpxP family protein refolding chaperone